MVQAPAGCQGQRSFCLYWPTTRHDPSPAPGAGPPSPLRTAGKWVLDWPNCLVGTRAQRCRFFTKPYAHCTSRHPSLTCLVSAVVAPCTLHFAHRLQANNLARPGYTLHSFMVYTSYRVTSCKATRCLVAGAVPAVAASRQASSAPTLVLQTPATQPLLGCTLPLHPAQQPLDTVLDWLTRVTGFNCSVAYI